MTKPTLKDYENRHNLKFPDKPISVLKKEGRFIYFNTPFGLCRKKDHDIGRNCYKVSSAVNKTEYLKNQLIFIYGNKYDFSTVIFLNTKSRLTLKCVKHNLEFRSSTSSAMAGTAGCIKCGRTASAEKRTYTKEYFISKAALRHKAFYNYDNVNYQGCEIKIDVTCPIHSNFSVMPSSHLQGSGCPKCRIEKIKKFTSENPQGWTLTFWIKNAKKSKNFDSFKLYIIRCWNEEEEFYKIGRTFVTVKRRFKSRREMPYKYELINEYKGTAEEIFKLETDLKRNNKKAKYIPKSRFDGMRECFKEITINEKENEIL